MMVRMHLGLCKNAVLGRAWHNGSVAEPSVNRLAQQLKVRLSSSIYLPRIMGNQELTKHDIRTMKVVGGRDGEPERGSGDQHPKAAGAII